MKISKLFHWCYAFLMLLPVFAVGVKCGYVMLNKNAKDSFSGSYTYRTSISLSDIKVKNNLTTTTITYDTNTYYYLDFYLFQNSFVGHVVGGGSSSSTNDNRFLINVNNVYFNDTYYPSVKSLAFTRNSSRAYIALYSREFNATDYYLKNVGDYIRIYDKLTNTEVGNLVQLFNYNNNSASISFSITNTKVYSVTSTPNLGFLSVYSNAYITNGDLSSVFYTSLQELDNTSFFSWAKDSFLSQPFMYIGNLFGIPNVHPIFTFLSYWCAISIIWLVFDLFMYMPLLVHKWIDKAKVE